MKKPKAWRGDFPMVLPAGGVTGVDPGSSSGGVGYVGEGFAFAWKLPNTPQDTWELIEKLGRVSCLFVLEKVHAMKGQGVSSTFKFGVSFGELRAFIIATRVRRDLPPPVTWQTKMKCRTGGDKNVSKRRAQDLWPQIKMTHAKADAMLLAEYGRQFVK